MVVNSSTSRTSQLRPTRGRVSVLDTRITATQVIHDNNPNREPTKPDSLIPVPV
ncbi:hypothetical protein B0T26DRAFT_689664 [Lasiosphaeria miniovina]|uniref:Uncharacterized protein n=1 Tax=Lasiosphaeria miniovina TaxID=1954250 RepID=A0AA40EAV1_9PEZI|nr:uncharacterized protein B0T26DRAFT_689664 [Lasiosphaeria miniovina]KAK0734794.1 hypothetical protein B0T26DRAFT_689664 [Lasiosphaeria miniovina]